MGRDLYAAYRENLAPEFEAIAARYHERRVNAAGALAALALGGGREGYGRAAAARPVPT